MRGDGYSDGPFVAVRVFHEPDSFDEDGWSIDAVDVDGNYSENVWTHWGGERMDRDAALAHALDFAAQYAPGVTEVREVPE